MGIMYCSLLLLPHFFFTILIDDEKYSDLDAITVLSTVCFQRVKFRKRKHFHCDNLLLLLLQQLP